jgi:hypothetical protein
MAQIKAKITELNDLTSLEEIEGDFAERVAQLKILAKVIHSFCSNFLFMIYRELITMWYFECKQFLGFLVFLPVTLSVFSTSIGFTSLATETIR